MNFIVGSSDWLHSDVMTFLPSVLFTSSLNLELEGVSLYGVYINDRSVIWPLNPASEGPLRLMCISDDLI